MKKLLFVGENPFGYTGCSHMMMDLISSVDYSVYQVVCFSQQNGPLAKVDAFAAVPFTNIDSNPSQNDPWGATNLINLVSNTEIDAVIFVGIDIWRYANAYTALNQLKNQKGFKLIGVFPYDLQHLELQWVEFFSIFDYCGIYSQYGADLLKEKLPDVKYFRPGLMLSDQFHPFEDKEERVRVRKNLYPSDDLFVFGFVGKNQIRKSPDKLIKAFAEVNKIHPSTHLYLHIDSLRFPFDLLDIGQRAGIENGKISTNLNQEHVLTDTLASVYRTFDCYIMPSMQEGLSLTIVEAQLSGLPVIASNTTSHPELLPNSELLVDCETSSYLLTGMGIVDTLSCSVDDLVEKMLLVVEDKLIRESEAERNLSLGKEWVENKDNIDDLLDFVFSKDFVVVKKQEAKTQAVLFAQHSAAGDVLMTTRCLKGLKERHPDLPLIYMTSPQYIEILEENPYIDQILPWDENLLTQFQFVYNPHGDRIAPGHWGRNSNSILSDFYHKILRVEPDDFCIVPKKSGVCDDLFFSEKDICIVHTTGGDAAFRSYFYMSDVCEAIKDDYLTVQVGGKDDCPAGAAVDLRGKLTYRETAYIVKHADKAICVDSFISHLCGALGVPTICLFGSGNSNVVKPKMMNGAKLIIRNPNYIFCSGLGPCSGAVKECPVKCTSWHNPKDIINDLYDLDTMEPGVTTRISELQSGGITK